MLVARLKKALEDDGIPYQEIFHWPAFSAQAVASRTHISGWQVAKTVVCIADDFPLMTVVAAPHCVDLAMLRAHLRVQAIRLATEEELRRLFPDCDLGAMPPFGSLWDMHTYVDVELAAQDHVSFPAGNHREIVKVRTRDYLRVERPTLASIATVRWRRRDLADGKTLSGEA